MEKHWSETFENYIRLLRSPLQIFFFFFFQKLTPQNVLLHVWKKKSW